MYLTHLSVAENRGAFWRSLHLDLNLIGNFYCPFGTDTYTFCSDLVLLCCCCKFDLGGGYLSITNGEPLVYTSRRAIFCDEWFRWRCAIYK